MNVDMIYNNLSIWQFGIYVNRLNMYFKNINSLFKDIEFQINSQAYYKGN